MDERVARRVVSASLLEIDEINHEQEGLTCSVCFTGWDEVLYGVKKGVVFAVYRIECFLNPILYGFYRVQC